MLVHAPLVLIPLALVADGIGFVANKPSARAMGGWCLLLGSAGAAVSIALGYYDMSRAALAPETHELVHLHLKIGWVLAALLVPLGLWRWRIARRPSGSHPGYLVYGALVVALTVFQGWFGGEMVYGYGAGVAAANQGTVSPEKGRTSLDRVRQFLEAIPGFHTHPEPPHATLETKPHRPGSKTAPP